MTISMHIDARNYCFSDVAYDVCGVDDEFLFHRGFRWRVGDFVPLEPHDGTSCRIIRLFLDGEDHPYHNYDTPVVGIALRPDWNKTTYSLCVVFDKR